MAPEPAPWPRQRASRRLPFAAAALAVVALELAWLTLRPERNGLGACAAVSTEQLTAAMHRPAPPGEQSQADGPNRDATVCSRPSSAIVFAVGPQHGEGTKIYGSAPAALGPPLIAISHNGYRATVVRGGGWTDIFVLKHGQYINVRLPADVDTDAARTLVSEIADRIK